MRLVLHATPRNGLILHRNKWGAALDLEQLTGRYRRLKDELASAYGEQPWPTGRIDRLAQDISKTEREMTAVGAPTLAAVIGKATARTPLVARNRLTPFGPRAPEPVGE